MPNDGERERRNGGGSIRYRATSASKVPSKEELKDYSF